MRWVAMFGIVALCFFSIKQRARKKLMLSRRLSSEGARHDPSFSLLAESIKDLVGFSGGLYIAIGALFAFLKMDTPESVSVFGVSFDPVAAFCVAASIAEPYFGRRG